MILTLVFFALMIAAFWFLILKPAKTKQAAAQKMVNELQVGQRVMTTAGMFGYVREITDEEVALEVADGVTIWMLKPAIAKLAEETPPSDSSSELSSDLPSDEADLTEAKPPTALS